MFRSFIYQLISSSVNTLGRNVSLLGPAKNRYGTTLVIVSPTGVPTPAYTALAGFISILRDTSTSSTRNYDWALTGQTAGVDHLLMHKGDGTLIVPLWIETESFDANANNGIGASVSVPQQTVLVNLPHTMGTAVVWTSDTTAGVWTSHPLTMAYGSLNLMSAIQ